MKKILITLLVFAMLMQCAWAVEVGAEEAASAPDVKINSWAQSGVDSAYAQGLVSPEFDMGEDYTRAITRLEFARLIVDWYAAEQGTTAQELAAAYDLTLVEPVESDEVDETGDAFEVQTGSFSDTNSAYAEVSNRIGVFYGSDGAFRPDDNITRAEAAAVLQRALSAMGITEADTQPKTFDDSYDIPRWAVEAVKFISGRTDGQGTAVMSGTGSGFSPLASFTIEQSILTLLRMHSTLSVSDVYADWRDADGYDVVRLTLTFGGDCTLGRHKTAAYSTSFDEMYDLHKNDLSYFFSGISEFYDDDLTMVNFEGTLTSSTTAAVKTFVFKGPAEYAKILKAGSIDVVSVANNHSMDYLQTGYDDTIRNLSPYVAVSGYEMMPIVTVKGVRIGFVSNTGWLFNTAQKNYIDNAISYLREAGADIIIFNFHWGVEYSYKSNATQQAIAHYAIDKGADLVIGHHPHVAQEVETYKGKMIAYSLGNLVFGGNNNPSDKNCLIFRQYFDFDLSTRTIVSQSGNAIAYRVSSVNTRNDYHPVPATK